MAKQQVSTTYSRTGVRPFGWAVLWLALGIVGAAIVFKYTVGRTPVVFINSPKVIDGYKRTSGVRKDLELRIATMRANVDTLSAELEAEMKRYEKARPGQTDRENELNLELLRNKREQFMRYQRTVEENVAKESEKVTAELLQEINTLTQAFAKAKGYGLVLGASGNGSIIYADDALDISDEVIEAINAE